MSDAPTFPLPAPPQSNRRRTKAVIIVLLLLVLAIFAVGIGVGYNYRVDHRRFTIQSPSMEPALNVGDTVTTDRLKGDSPISRGAIVDFDRPPGEPDKTISTIIKRVVGLPGETIEARGGNVYVNGKQLDEPYVLAPGQTTDLPATAVPANQYFVMGDNRTNSFDSRRFGSIDRGTIKAKATAVVRPSSHKKKL